MKFTTLMTKNNQYMSQMKFKKKKCKNLFAGLIKNCFLDSLLLGLRKILKLRRYPKFDRKRQYLLQN